MRIPSRPLRVAATALAATVITLAPPAAPARAQLFGMSEQQEIQIGRQVEAQVAKTYGFVNDPEKTHYGWRASRSGPAFRGRTTSCGTPP